MLGWDLELWFLQKIAADPLEMDRCCGPCHVSLS